MWTSLSCHGNFDDGMESYMHRLLHNLPLNSFGGSFMARLQPSDVINKGVECQGECWTFVQRNPQAKDRGDAQYLLWQWQIQTPPTAFSGFDIVLSPDLSNSSWTFLSTILRWGTQLKPRAAPAPVWSHVLYPDSEDKGLRRKKQ